MRDWSETMRTILRGRRFGKTYGLIRLADNKNGCIVCVSRQHAETIVSMANEMDCNINFPITFDEFINHKYYRHGIDKFLIDDADMLLSYLTDVRIEAITINRD